MAVTPLLTTLDSVNGATRMRENDALRVTPAEIAADVTPENYSYPPGYVERYGLNADPGTTDMSAALAAANLQAMEEGGAPINTDQILHIASPTTITGRFCVVRKQCFTVTSVVVFDKNTIDAVLPEWWGARTDAVIGDGTGTDSTDAIAAALIAATQDGDNLVAIHPVSFAPGNYLTGTQTMPPATTLRFPGWQVTNIVASDDVGDYLFTDTGSAAKIVITGGVVFWGRDLVVTALRLGYGVAAQRQHGVEGLIDKIWARDCTGFGIDIDGNVGHYGTLIAYDCGSGVRLTGVANYVQRIVAYAPTDTGVDLNLTDVESIEVEAPGDSCVPVYLTGNASIGGLVVSLADDTVIPYLLELSINVSTWDVRQFLFAFGSNPASITVSNGNIKRADATYCGGNATAGNRNGEGHYSSEHDGQTKQAFCVRIVNTAGTLQHYIKDASNNTTAATALVKCINGASGTLTNTPTGADASTAFAAGVKISSAVDSRIIFDTPSQRVAASDFSVEVIGSVGVALKALCSHQSINVNGVTRSRFTIELLNAATGNGFGINTTNITTGNLVQVVFSGYLSL
jgi:hypothetical protein